MGILKARGLIKSFTVFTGLLFWFNISYTQNIISGNISNPTNKAIPFANIILSNPENAIIAYTFSDEFGHFILNFEKIGAFNLRFSAMGFETLIIPIAITTETKELVKNVILKEKSFELKEVIIETKQLF